LDIDTTSDEIGLSFTPTVSDFILDDPIEFSSEHQAFDAGMIVKTGLETSESTSESSGWLNKPDLPGISGSEGKNPLTLDPTSSGSLKKKPPIETYPRSSTVAQIPSLALFKDKPTVPQKSISKKSLTMSLQNTLAKPQPDTDIGVPPPEEVTVTAPTLISHISYNNNHHALPSKFICQVLQPLNKNSIPVAPFTSWEEDGALFPPKKYILELKKVL